AARWLKVRNPMRADAGTGFHEAHERQAAGAPRRGVARELPAAGASERECAREGVARAGAAYQPDPARAARHFRRYSHAARTLLPRRGAGVDEPAGAL